MKYLPRLFAAALLLLFCLSAVSCSQPQAETPVTYTYDEYLTEAPTCWNPFTRETKANRYISDYTEMGLTAPAYDSETGGARWVYEMALQIDDVTAQEAAALHRFGLSGKEGLVWKITLNPNACWEDGTPITAADYVQSMQYLLDSTAKHSGAARFCNGAAALANACRYFENDQTGDPIYSAVVPAVSSNGTWEYHADCSSNTPICFSPNMPCAVLNGHTLAQETALYANRYECFAELAAYCNNSAYIRVTDKLQQILSEVAALYGFEDTDAWRGFCAFASGTRTKTEWNEVGLYVGNNAYTLYYVCAAPTEKHVLYQQLSENWLVHPALYTASPSTYATSVATYLSYGPYRLVSVDQNGVVFTRNDTWYGYSDKLHENEYQTTDIFCRIADDHREVLDLFTSGKLDVAALSPDDYRTLLQYRFSANLLRIESTYTQRLIFVTDRTALTALTAADPENGSRLLLCYPAFREAIGLAIDRADYVREGAVTDVPAFGLFSGLYFFDTAPAALYRYTSEARAALAAAYNLPDAAEDTLLAFTGYDTARAAALFTEAYEAALKAGDVTENEVFRFRCAVEGTALTPVQMRQQQLLQKYLTAATNNTPLENRLFITFEASDTRYEDIANGRIEMIIGAWGGAADNPYSLIRCYTDPAYAPVSEQCGFDPTKETCTISVNGQAQTKTFYAWGASLNAGGEYEDAPAAVQVQILAGLEQALLETHCFTVLSTDCSAVLFSDQIRFPTKHYHLLSRFGGIRTLRYLYNDAEWAAYIALQNGQLDYTATP